MQQSSPEPIDLPPLQEATLDDDELRALLQDIASSAKLLGVAFKGASEAFASDAKPDLEGALSALQQGHVRAVQLRYEHAGTEWWDTLMVTRSGIRLVRIEAPMRSA